MSLAEENRKDIGHIGVRIHCDMNPLEIESLSAMVAILFRLFANNMGEFLNKMGVISNKIRVFSNSIGVFVFS